MAGRDYPRLSIETFGHQLLTSQDIDPVYDALNGVGWDDDQRARFLVAYWCTYHVGQSCWFSEVGRSGAGVAGYWRALEIAAENTRPSPVGGRWPRAPERRHWRGDNAAKCVADLRRKYEATGPLGMIQYVNRPNLLTRELPLCRDALDTFPFRLIAARVQEHVAFGPWIAFKVADMLERCCGLPVAFAVGDVMYDSPTKAALDVWRAKAGVSPVAVPKDPKGAVNQVVEYLLDHFKDYRAPGGGRTVGFQEVETILCKWASHQHGHYPLHNDLAEISHGLLEWTPVSRAAKEFLSAMPRLKDGVYAVADHRG